MILPAATLMLTAFGSYTLVVRSSMLETARRGLRPHRPRQGPAGAAHRMAPRGAQRAACQMVTLIALETRLIVGGALLVEVIFSWARHRVSAMYSAIGQRDLPPCCRAGFLILTVSVILLNFVADLLYFRLDPRIST